VIGPAFWIATAAVVGACVGSFLNVVIWRLPRREGVARGRSRCPRCGHGIRWHDNVPVLSWLWLRARCRDCKGTISPRYPIVEALTAALFALVASRFPLPEHLARAGVAALVVAALVAVAFIDADHRIIPDAITKPGVVVGLLASFVLAGLRPASMFPEIANRHLAALLQAGLGAAAGALSLLAVRWAGWLLLRKEAMGLGDVKLLAMAGAFTAPFDVLMVILVGSVGGSVLGGAYVASRACRLAPLAGSIETGGARSGFARARIRAPRRSRAS
jgi:leader peptidase (prepilin peptidase)/N-methyltransferase